MSGSSNNTVENSNNTVENSNNTIENSDKSVEKSDNTVENSNNREDTSNNNNEDDSSTSRNDRDNNKGASNNNEIGNVINDSNKCNTIGSVCDEIDLMSNGDYDDIVDTMLKFMDEDTSNNDTDLTNLKDLLVYLYDGGNMDNNDTLNEIIEKNVSLGEKTVPLGEKTVSLGEKTVSFGEKIVPLGENGIVSSVTESNVGIVPCVVESSNNVISHVPDSNDTRATDVSQIVEFNEVVEQRVDGQMFDILMNDIDFSFDLTALNVNSNDYFDDLLLDGNNDLVPYIPHFDVNMFD